MVETNGRKAESSTRLPTEPVQRANMLQIRGVDSDVDFRRTLCN